MILSKPNDALVVGHCPRHRFRVVFADVEESARTLAERHACGPTSALVLAESLLAVALMSADVEEADETISLRLEFEGPVGGAFVEAAGSGDLRGYTRRKILGDLDERTDTTLADAIGSSVRAQVIRAKHNGDVITKAAFAVGSGDIRDAVLRYYAHSLQIASNVAMHVDSYDGRLEHAVAVVVQRLPDGDAEAFAALRASFESGSVTERLQNDTSLDGMRGILDLPELRVDRVRTLAFGCRCSQGRAEAALAAMSPAELNDIRRAGHDQHITCHMCGADYVFTPEAVGALIARKDGSQNE
jgi:molecular chaperone Hsp33